MSVWPLSPVEAALARKTAWQQSPSPWAFLPASWLCSGFGPHLDPRVPLIAKTCFRAFGLAGQLCLLSECLGSSPSSPLMRNMGGSWRRLKLLDPCSPRGRPYLKSQLLPLAPAHRQAFVGLWEVEQ